MKEIKEEVCKHIKDNLDPENVKAVAALAERFNAKQLFKAAFDYMQEHEVELEKEDVVGNPSLAVAFMKESMVELRALKEDHKAFKVGIQGLVGAWRKIKKTDM